MENNPQGRGITALLVEVRAEGGGGRGRRGRERGGRGGEGGARGKGC